MKDEIKNVVKLFDEVYSVFGLSYQIEVSTMPEDHMGDVKDWDFATETLKQAIEELGKDYGDNRHNSADSRSWGFVPEDHIVGKPILVWLSLDKDRSLFDGGIRWNRLFHWVHQD